MSQATPNMRSAEPMPAAFAFALSTIQIGDQQSRPFRYEPRADLCANPVGTARDYDNAVLH
jgi:hypothetical protein